MSYTVFRHPVGHWPEGHWPELHWPGTPDEEDKTPSDDLQHSPCFIVGSYLIAQSVFTLPSLRGSWPLYKSSLPVEADDVGAIYDTAPIVDLRISKSYPNTHYGLQVKVRAGNYETGKTKARAILASLETVQNGSVVFGVYEYEIRTARPVGGVISLGQEFQTTKRRYLFTVNFISTIKYMVAA